MCLGLLTKYWVTRLGRQARRSLCCPSAAMMNGLRVSLLRSRLVTCLFPVCPVATANLFSCLFTSAGFIDARIRRQPFFLTGSRSRRRALRLSLPDIRPASSRPTLPPFSPLCHRHGLCFLFYLPILREKLVRFVCTRHTSSERGRRERLENGAKSLISTPDRL